MAHLTCNNHISLPKYGRNCAEKCQCTICSNEYATMNAVEFKWNNRAISRSTNKVLYKTSTISNVNWNSDKY